MKRALPDPDAARFVFVYADEPSGLPSVWWTVDGVRTRFRDRLLSELTGVR